MSSWQPLLQSKFSFPICSRQGENTPVLGILRRLRDGVWEEITQNLTCTLLSSLFGACLYLAFPLGVTVKPDEAPHFSCLPFLEVGASLSLPALGLSRTSLTISAGITSTCCTLCLSETLRTRPSKTTCRFLQKILSGKGENLPPGLLNPGREYLHPSSSPRMIVICLSLPFFQHHSGYPQAALSLSRSWKCFLLQILSDIIHTYHNAPLPNKNCV